MTRKQDSIIIINMATRRQKEALYTLQLDNTKDNNNNNNSKRKLLPIIITRIWKPMCAQHCYYYCDNYYY